MHMLCVSQLLQKMELKLLAISAILIFADMTLCSAPVWEKVLGILSKKNRLTSVTNLQCRTFPILSSLLSLIRLCWVETLNVEIELTISPPPHHYGYR